VHHQRFSVVRDTLVVRNGHMGLDALCCSAGVITLKSSTVGEDGTARSV
jgi:hypothetical protein